MPQVTVYIREEDIDKWRSIRKKSRFISVALQTLSEDSMDLLEDQHQKYDTPTPVRKAEEESLLPLEIDPANKNRAWDPNIEEWVKV